MTNNANETYIPIIAVAAVDILGVKKLLKRGDDCVSAMKTLGLFVKNSSVRDYFKDDTSRKKEGALYKLDDYFGDSVYFFGETNLDIGDQVDRLALKCASLVAGGLKNGFLVRAGIAVGDLRIKIFDLYGGRKREVRIGNSMARAHTLHECQEWIGGAVESNYPPASREINRISYSVPIKENTEFKQGELEAVNWVYMLPINWKMSKDEVMKVVRDLVETLGDSSDEKIGFKLDNTIEFIEYVFSKEEFIK